MRESPGPRSKLQVWPPVHPTVSVPWPRDPGEKAGPHRPLLGDPHMAGLQRGLGQEAARDTPLFTHTHAGTVPTRAHLCTHGHTHVHTHNFTEPGCKIKRSALTTYTVYTENIKSFFSAFGTS